MRKVTREEILTGNPLKVMFVLSFPVMISQLLHTLYHLADTFWLGHLPPAESGEAVAGLQISWPMIWFLIALSFGFGIAGVALVSQYTGAGENIWIDSCCIWIYLNPLFSPSYYQISYGHQDSYNLYAAYLLGNAFYVYCLHLSEYPLC